MRNLLRSTAGSSVVEFALVAPVLVFLVIGVIEVGRYEYYAILTAHAARAGAQYGAQDLETAYDNAGIAAAVERDGGDLPNWTAANGAITVNQLCAASGSSPAACTTPWGSSPPQNTIYYVQVEVTGVFTSMLNFPGIPNSIPITSTAMMRVANQ